MNSKYDMLINRTSKRKRIYSHLPLNNTSVPITLEIFPTNKCNTNCSFCAFSKFKNKEELPFEIFNNLIDEIIKLHIKSVSFAGGGEPLIYPHINKIIEKLINNNIDVGIITNGLYMPDKLVNVIKDCSWIRFSLLSSNRKDFTRLTGTSPENFEKICNNIKKITKVSKNTKLYVSASYMSVANDDSLDKIYSFIKLASELDLDQIFIKKLVKYIGETPNTAEFYNKHKKDIDELSKEYGIVTNINKLISSETSKYKSRMIFENCDIIDNNILGLIDACGNYYPCMYQYANKGISYGNLHNISLIECLKNKDHLFNRIIESSSCDFCRHWSLRDEINKYKTSGIIEVCNDSHKNFI